MTYIFHQYKRLLTKYPLPMQAFQAGALMGLGDQISQQFIENKSFKNINFMRTAQFATVGFCLVGPATGTWYKVLDKFFGSRGTLTVLKKVTCDQLLFTPPFLVCLLSIIGVIQKGTNDLKMIKLKLKDEYLDILFNNYKLWPMVQLVNFYSVPLQYQVLVVQAVAILWNTYISYRTNRENTLEMI